VRTAWTPARGIVRRLAVASDGRTIAVGGDGKKPSLRDTMTGQKIGSLDGMAPLAAAFTPDDGRLDG